MKLKKWVSLAVGLCLVAGLTGCIGNFYPNAMTVDGTDIGSGMYLMIQYNAYQEAEGKIDVPETDEAEAEASSSEPAQEEEVKVLKSTVEGKKAEDWIAARTEELCRRYVLVSRLCFEKGITLNEEGQSALEQNMGFWEYLAETYEDNGISAETFQRYLANESLANQLFLEMYGEDGELAPTDDEMKEEYSAKNAHVRFISMPVTASDEEQTDMTAQVEEAAAAMLEDLKGGKTMEDVAKDSLAAVYDTLEIEFDATTAADQATTSYIAYEQPDDSTTYTPEFLEELKNQAVGDFGSYNMGSTVLLYEKIPTFETEEDFTGSRDTIVASLYSEAFDEYLASIYNNYTITRPAGSQWYFRPGKIVA